MVPFHPSTAKRDKKTEAVESQREAQNIPFLLLTTRVGKLFEADGNPPDWQVFKLLFIRTEG